MRRNLLRRNLACGTVSGTSTAGRQAAQANSIAVQAPAALQLALPVVYMYCTYVRVPGYKRRVYRCQTAKATCLPLC